MSLVSSLGYYSRELLYPSFPSFGVAAPGFLKTLFPHHSVAFNHASLDAEESLVSVIAVPLATLTFFPCSVH